MQIYFWTQCSVPLICIFGFVPVPHVLLSVALQRCLKSRRVVFPASLFLLRTGLGSLGLLHFCINFRIICSSSVKNFMVV